MAKTRRRAVTYSMRKTAIGWQLMHGSKIIERYTGDNAEAECEASLRGILQAPDRRMSDERRASDAAQWAKDADHVDGYDRDDLGESPDY